MRDEVGVTAVKVSEVEPEDVCVQRRRISLEAEGYWQTTEFIVCV